MEFKNVVPIASRSGRQLQRYNKGQQGQVVGCIPYRININALEVLMISAQRKGKGMLFPKGGWESDETIKEAALRVSVEDAGVYGIVEGQLGKWFFKSKGNDGYYEGHMFPLLVKEQLEYWRKQDISKRVWVSVSKVKKVCQHTWMKEALDLFLTRLESAPLSSL